MAILESISLSSFYLVSLCSGGLSSLHCDLSSLGLFLSSFYVSSGSGSSFGRSDVLL